MLTVATSRKKTDAPPVGRDVDALADIAAVELERVGAGLALDYVVVVARVPDERVVARPEQRGIVAVAADDAVVALAADQHVVTQTCVDGELDLAGGQKRGIEHVFAGAEIDRQLRDVGAVEVLDGDHVVAGGSGAFDALDVVHVQGDAADGEARPRAVG